MATSDLTPPNETTIASLEEPFEDTPEGWAKRFTIEFDAAEKELKDWHDAGDKIIKQFLDDRKNDPHGDTGSKSTRLNFYSTGVKFVRAMVFGKTPKVAVERRFGDPNDDVARVAGVIIERMLNTDLEREDDTFCLACLDALTDYQMPGLAYVKQRYCFDCEKVPGKPAIQKTDENGEIVEYAAAVPETERRTNETIESDYVNWKDNLWNAGCRTYRDRRWSGYRSKMSRESLKKRFGQEGTKLPLNSKRQTKSSEPDASQQDPIATADVWEVWDKEHSKRFFYVKGYVRVLELQDMTDEVWGLPGFWPGGRPMMANLTTSKHIPRPDYILVQDVIEEINVVSTRITHLQQTISAKGVYDKTAGEQVGRLLQEGSDNQLFPVENWQKFAAAGGLEGTIDLLPLDTLVAALDKLRDYRQELIQIFYQLTSWSDIMRGQQMDNGTPGEAQLKTRFASVLLQALQDEFARFVTDNLRIKAWLIAKFFEPQTIVERSNAMYLGEPPELVMQAVQFIKGNIWHYRIVVKSEALALDDFSEQKAEAMEVMSSITAVVQSMAPLAAQLPQAIPMMLEVLKVTLSRLKGGSTYETILDPAITQAKQMLAQAAQQPQQPQAPDPRTMAQLMKNKGDQDKIMLQAQVDTAHIAQETQAVKERAEHASQLKMQETVTGHAAKAAFTSPKLPQGTGGP